MKEKPHFLVNYNTELFKHDLANFSPKSAFEYALLRGILTRGSETKEGKTTD